MIYDFIGIFGVSLILIAYGLVQMDRLPVKNIYYSVLNALGAFFIIVSLLIDFNLSAFLMEFFWLVFSIAGIYKYLKNRHSNNAKKGVK
ncbi:hypothetical protein N8972_01100 [Sulfurospirillum sp.]|nr:hypothetical protein [Sulfurospirillum sp.]